MPLLCSRLIGPLQSGSCFFERPLLATLLENVMTRERKDILILIVIASLVVIVLFALKGYSARAHEPRDSFGDIPQSPGNFAAE